MMLLGVTWHDLYRQIMSDEIGQSDNRRLYARLAARDALRRSFDKIHWLNEVEQAAPPASEGGIS